MTLFDSPPSYDDDPAWNRAKESVWDLDVTALECKGIYVAGLVRHLVEGAGLCLKNNMQLSAFVGASAAAEALGQIAHAWESNEDPHSSAILADGLLLAAGGGASRDAVVVTTDAASYTVRHLIHRRGFAAHGAAGDPASGPLPQLDGDLTPALLGHVLDGLDRAWSRWRDGDDQWLGRLTKANTMPLFTRGKVVFVPDLHGALSDGALPGGEVLHEEWRR